MQRGAVTFADRIGRIGIFGLIEFKSKPDLDRSVVSICSKKEIPSWELTSDGSKAQRISIRSPGGVVGTHLEMYVDPLLRVVAAGVAIGG